MINTWIGNIGHLAVILSLVSTLMTLMAYGRASLAQKINLKDIRFARKLYYVHLLSVTMIMVLLFYMIYHHLYEYYYVYAHSSNLLPVHYMISCFWEGQEGSFLLWIFWNAILGLFLIRKQEQELKAPVMFIFMGIQFFLLSMVLGVVLPFDLGKIGSSPFMLTRDVLDIPVYNPSLKDIYNPDFIPTDGRGLNPLLQNYWMVIHPPTLFLGFALCAIPFSYLMAALWKKQYTQWIKPAQLWLLIAASVLGIGIMMGAYWAYETLNFGGYWNWDPVENAVYIPWLILIAAFHGLKIFERKKKGLKTSMILILLSFLLILYATFLTRSGILANTSVHSFTDLGLSGQLLIYLISFLILSVCLLSFRWKHLPNSKEESKAYSADFWLLIGVLILGIAAFQVFLTTSIPVFNAILASLGISSNLAPPADQVAHYSKFQIWFSMLIVLLSGIGQFFWWKRIDAKNIGAVFSIPIIITFLCSALIILLGKINHPLHILILSVSLLSIFLNGNMAFSIFKKNMALSGGSIAHIGIALMLMGILFSSSYSKTISVNTSGLLYSSDESIPDDFNTHNVLLWLNKAEKMGDYTITYRGNYIEANDFPSYIHQSKLKATDQVHLAVANTAITYKGSTYFNHGDTLQIHPENIYYKIEYKDQKGSIFNLYPRVQFNPTMGLAVSPSIYKKWTKDMYTHVVHIYPDPTQDRTWGDVQKNEIAVKDTFFVNDYVAVLESVQPVENKTQNEEIIIEAKINIYDQNLVYTVQPQLLINPKENLIASPSKEVEDLGLKISFTKIDTEKNTFLFEWQSAPKPYIIMKAEEKPMINLLWIGTIIMTIGFIWAIINKIKKKQ